MQQYYDYRKRIQTVENGKHRICWVFLQRFAKFALTAIRAVTSFHHEQFVKNTTSSITNLMMLNTCTNI